MYAHKFQAIFCFISIILPNMIFASCWETQLEYEITQNCEVRIISVTSESESLKDEAHWLDYIQNRPSSAAEIQAGVPKTARKIFRPDDISSLYCEFDENGLISKAYSIPTMWNQFQGRWVYLEKQPIDLKNGLLPSTQYHNAYIDTCR